MWVTKGDSEGKKVQESSSAFACQNSLSHLTYTGSILGLSFKVIKKRSSVDTQKYDTARKLIFSRIESLDNSISLLLFE